MSDTANKQSSTCTTAMYLTTTTCAVQISQQLAACHYLAECGVWCVVAISRGGVSGFWLDQ